MLPAGQSAAPVEDARSTELLRFMNLFPEFRDPSWDGWRSILARITSSVREFYGIIGRGAGKSRTAALLACFFAAKKYRRAPGENIFVGVFAPDRKQAALTFRYILGLLHSVPALENLIAYEGKDTLELSNGVIVEVVTSSIAAPRGRAYALCIVEEAAYLPQDSSVNPDYEIIRAVRPGLARVPGSLLVVISSPYARKGVLYAAWQRHFNQPDGEVVVVQADTRSLNPTFSRREIDRAFEEDPTSASAEYAAQFRSDVETFVSRDVIDANVMSGRFELPPTTSTRYTAFVDPSGGMHDSFTLAIGHYDQTTHVLDALREVKPPFSPDHVVAEFATLLKSYRVYRVTGDRYGGEWPRERFRVHGIHYDLADKPKSDLYKNLLPLLNSRRVELLDAPRLIAQLASLERLTARGGKDSIDHPKHSHDDVANVLAGVVSLSGVSAGRVREAIWGSFLLVASLAQVWT